MGIPPLVIHNSFTPITMAQSALVNQNYTDTMTSVNQIGAAFNAMMGEFTLAMPVDGPTDTANLNAALLKLFNAGGGVAAQPDVSGAGTGGTLKVPQYQYTVVASPTGLPIPQQAKIEGVGFGGRGVGGGSNPSKPFFHFVGSGSGAPGAPLVLFSSDAINHYHGSYGWRMDGIGIRWSASTNPYDTALIVNSWNGRLDDMNFLDCPCAIQIGGLDVSVRRPCIQYGQSSAAPDYATAIWNNGQGAQITGPAECGVESGYNHTSLVFMTLGGPVQGSEIQETNGLHIFGWDYALDYADINNIGMTSGVQKSVYIGLVCDIRKSCINLTMRKNNDGATTSRVLSQKYFGCTFMKSHHATGAEPIVVVDTNGSPNGQMVDVELYGCTIFSQAQGSSGGQAMPNQYGAQFNAGNDIRVFGGVIAHVGTKAGNDGTANVAITDHFTPTYNGFGSPGYPASPLIAPTTGAPVTSITNGPNKVLLDGVVLTPDYSGANVGNDPADAAPSMYALLLTGILNGTYDIRNCDMSGFPNGWVPIMADNAVFLTSYALQVSGCRGYNDVGFVISTLFQYVMGSVIAGTTGISASTAKSLGSGSINYFGASNLRFVNANTTGTVTWHIGSYAYPLGVGAIIDHSFAHCGEHWFLQFQGGATIANITNYAWIGK